MRPVRGAENLKPKWADFFLKVLVKYFVYGTPYQTEIHRENLPLVLICDVSKVKKRTWDLYFCS